MAQRVEIREAVAPLGTPQSAPVEIDLSFDPGTVTEIEIVIPDGHGGATGIAIAQAHGIIIPYSGSVFIIGNNEVIHWPVQDFLNNGSWSAFVYNTDTEYDHTFYLRFLINENPRAIQAAIAQPLQPAAILTATSGGG